LRDCEVMNSSCRLILALHNEDYDPAYVAPVWEFHSPLNFSPRIPKDRILIVSSRGDRLCPFEHVRQLTGKWEAPKHYFLHGGHWLVFNNIRGKVWYGFLEEMGFTS